MSVVVLFICEKRLIKLKQVNELLYVWYYVVGDMNDKYWTHRLG